MRPESHRDQVPEKRCGNCRHSHLVSYKLDLLCFHGDKIQVTGQSRYPVDSDHVLLESVPGWDEVGMLDGDAYSEVWAERVVDPCDVCDEWQEEDKPNGG